MIWFDAVVIIVLMYAAYVGAQRGGLLAGLELATLMLAAACGFALYRPLGHLLEPLAHIANPLANITAFMIVWVGVEISGALMVRFLLLPKLSHLIRQTRLSRFTGAGLSSIKTLLVMSLALLIFASLALPAAVKQPVTTSVSAKVLRAASGPLQTWLNAGLAQDLSKSLDFFQTVPAEPESEQRIELGFTTTEVRVDPAAEAEMLVLVNRERTSRNLAPLKLNAAAQTVARTYARDMLARGYFSHINPEGKNPFDRMKSGGVSFISAGENLALAPTLQQAHAGLMNSPGHRANILSPKYHTVGLGIINGGPYGLMVTQAFTD